MVVLGEGRILMSEVPLYMAAGFATVSGSFVSAQSEIDLDLALWNKKSKGGEPEINHCKSASMINHQWSTAIYLKYYLWRTSN